jgi:hypothetical protein
MKKYITLLLIVLFANTAFAIDAMEVLKKIESTDKYKDSEITAMMKIINSEGKETVMEMIMFDKKGDGDKQLMRFTSPPRLKGTSILTVGDNMWYYNRRTNRVRLLSKSAKKGSMMGSSFSYDDMTKSYSKDFTGTLEKETKKEYILKLIPNDKDKKFKYIIMTVNKINNVPTIIEYYNDSSDKYKVMTSEDIVKIGSFLVPLKVTMVDLNTQKTTVMTMDEKSIKYDQGIKDKIFSQRSLAK